MEKEDLLLKMMENLGRSRGEKKHDRKKHHSHDKAEDQREKERKPHHKLSPVAEHTLYLLYHEGSMNQRSLARRLQVTGQAVSELMKKFEEKGFIIRQSGDLNNENMVYLTEKGQEKGKECLEKLQKRANLLFRNFTEEDLKTMDLLLDKMETQEEIR